MEIKQKKTRALPRVIFRLFKNILRQSKNRIVAYTANSEYGKVSFSGVSTIVSSSGTRICS